MNAPLFGPRAAQPDLDVRTAASMLPRQTRREFLRLLTGAAAGAVLPASVLSLTSCEDLAEQIANRPVRKDVHTLATDDPMLESYRAAVSAMKGLPTSDRRNWTRQAEIHLDFCPHGNWLFLPWHRAYLNSFEQICRELSGDDNFGLPYWNWTDNPQMPAAFLDPSSSLFDGSRSATATSTANSAIVGQTNIDSILSEPNFLNFASGQIGAAQNQRDFSRYDPLEGGPHNSIHGFVGGNMASFMSPLDPLFWLHHNRIEQLWLRWNLTLGNPNTNDSAWTNREFTEFVDRDGNPQRISVATTLLYPIFSYRFDVL